MNKGRMHFLNDGKSMGNPIKKAIKILSFPKNLEKRKFQRTTMVKKV